MIVMMKARKSILSLFQSKECMDRSKCLNYLNSFLDEQYVPPTVDFPMKQSKYNIEKRKGRTYIIYNTLFNSMVTLSDAEFEQYERLAFWELNMIESLVDNGFIIPAFVDEYQRYDYYKQILSQQIDSPAHYTVALTSKCNARCVYCYEEGIAKSDMSLETANAFADVLLLSNREIDITWFGGEPLLKTDLIAHISTVLNNNQKKFKAGIITNGSLLTKEMIEADFPLWNVEWIQITLDGMTDEYLKRKRYYNEKKEIFDTIIKNIGYLIQNRIYVSVRLNIDSENREDCMKAAAYLKETYTNCSYLSVYPAFLYSTPCSIFDECKRISYCEDIYFIYPPETELLSSIPRVNPCFFTQKNSFVIDTDGSILACDGDVGKQHTKFSDLCEISNFDNVEKPTSVIPTVREMCKNCSYFPKCGGGCMSVYNSRYEYDACFMERYKVEYLLNRLIDI